MTTLGNRVTGTASVLRGDARQLPLADDTVDLVVTSPPYFALRSYQDAGEHYAGQIGDEPTPSEFVAALLDVTRECVRVLKPTGSLWVNLGDKYATYAGNRSNGRSSLQGSTDRSRPVVPRSAGLDGGGEVRSKSLMGIPWRYALGCIDDLGLILRAEVIWSKPNGMPESVTDRVRRSHEQWFHFTLEPRYYSAVDHIREPHVAPFQVGLAATFARPRPSHDLVPGQSATQHRPDRAPGRRLTGGAPKNQAGQRFGADGSQHTDAHPLGKLPGSVWTIATEPLRVPDQLGVDHYAAFPTEWPKRIIQGWSPDTGTVLDPFGGTGTTAMAAKALGRHGISVDMSADYCRLGQWRTTDRDQLAKVLGVAKPSGSTAAASDDDLFSLIETGTTP